MTFLAKAGREGLVALAYALSVSARVRATAASIPGTVRHAVQVDGVELQYVEAGQGDPVLLLPGWLQDGYAWRAMVPLLVAQHRRVIVLDPRGFGDSAKPASGYDLDTAAADVHNFIAAAGLRQAGGIDVVSHDLGAWIGYALASAYPGDVRRLVLSEATLPDPAADKPIPDDGANIRTWHFGFNRLPGLPETLVGGHERAFLDWLFDNKATRPGAIDARARAEYVRAISLPGAASAGFNYYRELFGAAGLKRMGERLGKPLTMPVLTVGAEGGVGELLHQSLGKSATSLQGTVLPGCGHYLPEECPAAFSDAIGDFWRSTSSVR